MSFCETCLRDECACVQEALRPPQTPPERPWKVTVALDGTREVWETERSTVGGPVG